MILLLFAIVVVFCSLIKLCISHVANRSRKWQMVCPCYCNNTLSVEFCLTTQKDKSLMRLHSDWAGNMMTVKGRWHEATKLVSYLQKKQLGIANFPSLFTRDIHTKRFGKASLTMSGSGKRSDGWDQGKNGRMSGVCPPAHGTELTMCALTYVVPQIHF